MDKSKLANISKSDDMSLIILCLFVFSILFGCYDLIFINYSLFKTVKRLIGNKRTPLRNTKNIIKFHLFVPVLYEEEALKKIVNHLLKMHYRNYKIYILTTQKNVLNHDNLQSIIKIALSLKKQYPHKIDVIHYPYTFGNKASQLNYALQFIPDEPNSYIGIYDVDSVPDLNTLSDIEQEILKFKLEFEAIVIQQASLFFENMQYISSYMKLEAILQTKRSLGIEIPTYINTMNHYKSPFYSIPYCVGHGLFVKTSFILEQNGFLEPIEDVPFGVRLAAKRLPIIPLLHSFDNSEVPKNILNLFKQSGMWFHCTLSGFKEAWKQAKNGKNIDNLFKSFADIYSWVYFLVYIVTGVYLTIQGHYWVCYISIPLVFVNALISIHYVLKVYQSRKGFSMTLWDKILFVLLYPVRESIRGLAPFCYIFSLFKFKGGKTRR